MAQSSVDASLTSTDILLLCGVDVDVEPLPPLPLPPPPPPHPASIAEIAPANNSLDEFAFMGNPPRETGTATVSPPRCSSGIACD
jgi:hypothetical protein